MATKTKLFYYQNKTTGDLIKHSIAYWTNSAGEEKIAHESYIFKGKPYNGKPDLTGYSSATENQYNRARKKQERTPSIIPDAGI